MTSAYKDNAIYIVDGLRTPFLKAKGKPGPFSAADMAVACGKALLKRQDFAATDIGEVVIGCTIPSPDEANIARIIGLRLGCGDKVPGFTVHRNCGSGMQALDNAAQDIASGRFDLVLAGGVDAMSQAPLLYNQQAVLWFAQLMQTKSLLGKLTAISKFRPAMLKPVIALLHGLTDPIACLSMGQTAENLAYQFDITRTQMDEFAVRSHQRLAAAQQEHLLTEITPLYDKKGKVYEQDDGVRVDSSVEGLAKLKPFFDKKFGKVTAGNSSQVTDGAALLILASQAAVKRYQLPILAKIVDVEWAALDPAVMGLGPAFAIAPLLQRNKLGINDIDYWEINEAFAAQVIACVKALASADFSSQYLGLNKPLGEIDQEKLNIYGDAICMGHPIGASGARLVLQLSQILQKKNARYGVAALCIGGGQGGAMLIENVNAQDSNQKDAK